MTDAETALDRLTFAWSSPLGTFTGQGPACPLARAPRHAPAPLVAPLRLLVVDGDQRVERTHAVRVHHHVREVGDMATLFLSDFSNSTPPSPATVMRNFLPGCYGTADEQNDVEIRRNYLHVSTRPSTHRS